MLKHAADRPAVMIALGVTTLDVAVYLTTPNAWWLLGYVALMTCPKACLGAWNHHHQHSNMFRSPFMNRVLELCFALQSGMAPFLWVLHHNFGHHLNFLDQTKDESRWKDRHGRRMGVVKYTLSVALTAYPRAFQVGRRFPELQRRFVGYSVLLLAGVGGLVWYKPIPGLLLFVLPMVVGILFVAWVTFDHHSGLFTTDEFEASHNVMHRWYNVLTGNLGYHTAHHHRQGLHWSQLPKLHEKIKDKIPAHCYRQSAYDIFFPPDDSELTLELATARKASGDTVAG